MGAILAFLGVYRWLAMAAVIGALVAGFFGWQHHVKSVARDEGRAEIQQKWDDDKAKQVLALNAANKAAHEKEQSLQRTKDEALHAAAQREKKLRADLAAARATGDGLRNDLAAARGDVSRASLSSLRAYATTLAAVFGECTAEVERLAGAAAGHASDALMLEKAWPK